MSENGGGVEIVFLAHHRQRRKRGIRRKCGGPLDRGGPGLAGDDGGHPGHGGGVSEQRRLFAKEILFAEIFRAPRPPAARKSICVW